MMYWGNHVKNAIVAATGSEVSPPRAACQDEDRDHRLGAVRDRRQRVAGQHGQRHQLAHPLEAIALAFSGGPSSTRRSS